MHGALGEFLAVWFHFFLVYWAFVCGEFIFILFYYWVQFLGLITVWGYGYFVSFNCGSAYNSW
jgi:hypothetical protein